MLHPLLVARRVRLDLPLGLVVWPFRLVADALFDQGLDAISDVGAVVRVHAVFHRPFVAVDE